MAGKKILKSVLKEIEMVLKLGEILGVPGGFREH